MLSYSHGDRNIREDMAKMCSLAKAKYDNLAESHDELAFRKGDVLTVVDQKIDGLEGWWLCSFRGKQGIVPANRVTLLAGLYHESALRFSTSPDSSVSDGGGVDYDIPRNDAQDRRGGRLPSSQTRASSESSHGSYAGSSVRELVYDIPKSLEKSRVQMTSQPATNPHNQYAHNLPQKSQLATDNLYDTPKPAAPLNVSPAGLLAQRGSAGLMSPLYKSGDSAVDMMSNRSSMMSNTSSPPGSTFCDSSSECATDIYDTPTSLRLSGGYRRTAAGSASRPPPHRQYDKMAAGSPLNRSTEGHYDVPKTIQEALLDYRDSGIYDNARLSAIQSSPQKEAPLYDSPSSAPVGTTSAAPHTGCAQPIDECAVYDVPSQLGRQSSSLQRSDTSTSVASSNLSERVESIDLSGMEKLSLELEAAIEIIVKLQQHVHTSANRLLSFVHSKWRQRFNLEAILYDLKISCVGLQSTLDEFYDFGVGSLANSAALADKTVMNRLSHALVPLKQKLDTINASMKSLSASKWQMAKLEETSSTQPGGDNLARMVTVAREVSEDVSRVASVIHGNSSLLFRSALTVDDVSTMVADKGSGSCVITDDSLESYHEYDYCEVYDRQDTPTNEQHPKTAFVDSAADIDQDSQYLRYYLQHVHTTCDTVNLHISRLNDIVGSGQSTQMLVSHSKLLVSTAHKLVYIGDTLCRSVRQASLQTAITLDANALCNALKDFIMSTKEAALCPPSAKTAAMSKLAPNIKSIALQTETFRNVISVHAK